MTVALQTLFDEILLEKDERKSTVIYFDAEANFNVERSEESWINKYHDFYMNLSRLQQIATAMLNARKGFCRDCRAEDLLDRLFILNVDTLAQFLTK